MVKTAQKNIPHYWDEAKYYLVQKDPVLGKIIEAYQGEALQRKYDAFTTLARAITGQQISVKAADKIWSRMEMLLKNTIRPEHVLEAPVNALRSIGYSSQKVNYLKDISDAFISGRFDPNAVLAMEAEVAIVELVKLKGIGRWTAEMFLIFHALQPDVLPLADLGLIKAIEKNYNEGKALAKTKIDMIACKWHPYRTVATWYLWRSLDPVPVEY